MIKKNKKVAESFSSVRRKNMKSFNLDTFLMYVLKDEWYNETNQSTVTNQEKEQHSISFSPLHQKRL